MKTIKQIADEIGVSKQAVQKRISREPLCTSLHTCISTIKGTKYIDKNGERLIKSSFGMDEHMDNSDNQPPNVYADVHTLVSMLQSELNSKNQLLEEQQQSIRELTSALENTTASLHAAQALHAGTMQQQLLPEASAAASVAEEPPEKRRGFWGWLNKRT